MIFGKMSLIKNLEIYTKRREVYIIPMLILRAIFALLFILEGLSHNAFAESEMHCHPSDSVTSMSADTHYATAHQDDCPPNDCPHSTEQPSEHICHLSHTCFVTPGNATAFLGSRFEYDLIVLQSQMPSDPKPGSFFRPPRA
jgi:hypothetical protein